MHLCSSYNEIWHWLLKQLLCDVNVLLAWHRFRPAWRNLLLRSSSMLQSNCMFNPHWCSRERVCKRLVAPTDVTVLYLFILQLFYGHAELISLCFWTLFPKGLGLHFSRYGVKFLEFCELSKVVSNFKKKILLMCCGLLSRYQHNIWFSSPLKKKDTSITIWKALVCAWCKLCLMPRLALFKMLNLS